MELKPYERLLSLKKKKNSTMKPNACCFVDYFIDGWMVPTACINYH